MTVKASTINLLTEYGYVDNTRMSTGSGSEKSEAGYVTIGHTAPIPVDKTTYPQRRDNPRDRRCELSW